MAILDTMQQLTLRSDPIRVSAELGRVHRADPGESATPDTAPGRRLSDAEAWRLRARLAQIARETDVHEDALDRLEKERAAIAERLLGTMPDDVVPRPPGALETVVLASSELGDTFSAADVARVTGMHRDTANWALHELVARGIVRRGAAAGRGVPVPHWLVRTAAVVV